MESSQVQQLKDEVKLFRYLDFFPNLAENVFLASGVKIIGNVEIGKDSSVWYNSVIRGDVHYIKIGEKTNIQDCSMLHVTNRQVSLKYREQSYNRSFRITAWMYFKDLCLIGIGAVVLDGAVIESNSMVAAGALVKPNFVVPSGKLVGGVPAKVIRDLTEVEIEDLEASAERYKKYTEITIKSLD